MGSGSGGGVGLLLLGLHHRGPMLELIYGNLDGQTRTSLAAVRLTVIEGGKSPNIQKA